MQRLLYMALNIQPKVNQSGCEILFVEAKKVLRNIISIYKRKRPNLFPLSTHYKIYMAIHKTRFV